VIDEAPSGDRVKRFVRHRLARTPLRTKIFAGFMVLVALFAVGVVAVAATVRSRDQTRSALNDSLRPAQSEVDSLAQSLLDQQASVNTYQLTGTVTSLAPYVAGFASQKEVEKQLKSQLSGYPAALTDLRRATTAANSWNTKGAFPSIEARRSGPVPPSVEAANTEHSNTLFGVARARTHALAQSIAQSVSQETIVGTQASNDLSIITWLMLAIAVVLSVLLFAVLRGLITRPLESLGRSVAAAGAGNLEQPIDRVGPAEIANLAGAVEQMRLRLLSQAEETLRRSLIVAQDEERRRIAQDMHDDSVQALVAVTLRLQRLATRLTDAEQLNMVQAAEAAVSDAIGRLRQQIFELFPSALESEGLEAALRALLAETLASEDTAWEVTGPLYREPSRAVRVLAYRLAREAVLNVAKHAHAGHVVVSIEGRNGGVGVSVRDDGVGFDPAAVSALPGHLGQPTLASMAEAAGGWSEIRSAAGQGTTVTFWLPDVPVSAYK
jgi:signal transduction histidine kinase